MQINKQLRHKVIEDLKSSLVDSEGNSLIAAYFSGRGEPVTASADGDSAYLEVPAIAVYLLDGEALHSSLSAEEWQFGLAIEIMDLATNQLDDDLDEISQKVMEVIGQDYTAGGLITLCNRSRMAYIREDGAPWGSLALTFIVELETE
ncbi:phage tail protein [Vibrio cholerae]|nr:phage tail protein [Vibrio cholerae]